MWVHVDCRNLTLCKNSKASKDENAYLAGKKRLIAPPTVNKSPFVDHEMFDYLWETAGKSIRESKRIIFWGYSMPVTDLSVVNFIAEHAPEDCKVVLANWDTNIEAKYKTVFSSLCPKFVYRTFCGANYVKEFLKTYPTS